MKRKLILIASMLFIGLCVPACSEDEDNNEGTEITKPQEKKHETFLGTINVGEYSKPDVKTELCYESQTELKIKLNKVRFAEAMPIELDIELRGITYTEDNSVIRFEAAELVPYVAGGEMPDYKMTNLSGKVENNTLQLQCSCKGMLMEYTGTKQ